MAEITTDMLSAADAESSREMPKYKCHKEVHALKIASVETAEGPGAWIVPADEGYGKMLVSPEYVAKHDPQTGGYYVVYADGYTSYSPGDVFEAGYTRIKE